MLQELREIVTAAIGTKFSARWGEQMVEMVRNLPLLSSFIASSARFIFSRLLSCNVLSIPIYCIARYVVLFQLNLFPLECTRLHFVALSITATKPDPA